MNATTLIFLYVFLNRSRKGAVRPCKRLQFQTSQIFVLNSRMPSNNLLWIATMIYNKERSLFAATDPIGLSLPSTDEAHDGDEWIEHSWKNVSVSFDRSVATNKQRGFKSLFNVSKQSQKVTTDVKLQLQFRRCRDIVDSSQKYHEYFELKAPSWQRYCAQ